jgi:hypothetical protein
MQVENIECQIAQAQIGNFLAGSGLSQEAMQQLEDHIAGCANCKAVLSERRNELKAMLTGERAVVDFEKIAIEAEGTKAKNIATALRKKSLQQMLEPAKELPVLHRPEPKVAVEPVRAVVEQPKAAPVQPEPSKAPAKKPASNWKPLVYSLGLAAVLVGMSLFSNNIAAIFGPKANASAKIAANTPASNGETIPAPTGPVSNPAGAPVVETSGQVVPSSDTTGTGAATTETNPVTSSEATTPVSTPPPSTATPPKVEPAPEPTTLAAVAIGSSAGALSTTQFDSAESVPEKAVAVKPITPAPTKAVVKKAATPRIAPRRFAQRRIARKPARRVVARKPVVRSRGIKVYNPN